MTSLTEVYEENKRGVTSLRRLYAGTALVLLGAVLSVVAVLVATIDPLATVVAGAVDWGMDDHFAVVRVAGALAGLGVPAALVGVFIVLPASHRVQAAAAISASLCLLGVSLFWYAYPDNWRFGSDQLTLEVSAIYLLGLFTALWCLFTAIVNFKTRNDPGGMLEMTVASRDEPVLEDESESDSDPEAGSGSAGGVGLFGSTPDGNVATQTNDVNTGSTNGVTTSDGGSVGTDITSPLDGEGSDAEIVGASGSNGDSARGDRRSDHEPTDQYCGNCRHFQYARSSSGIVPYCTLDGKVMDDMDDCDAWDPNRK